MLAIGAFVQDTALAIAADCNPCKYDCTCDASTAHLTAQPQSVEIL